jgi:hypothetical protein
VVHARKPIPLINFVSLIKIDKVMETIRVDILNPKAKSLLKDLADLDLIRIKKDKVQSEFKELLDNLRTNSDNALSLDEITAEVESVRKARYEK